MRIVTVGAVGAIALSLALTAQAEAQLLTRVNPDCDYILNVDPDASQCSGAWAGNNKEQEAAVFNQFAADGWGTSWDLSLDGDWEGEDTFGTITFSLPLTEFVLALRSANQFSLYYWDGSGGLVSSVDWETSGVAVNSNQQVQALSGWTVYTVPEPGALLLLGTGLLGMTMLRRREDLA